MIWLLAPYFWLANYNDSSIWFAFSSLPPICNVSFSSLGGVEHKEKLNLYVRNSVIGSHTEHRWRCSELPWRTWWTNNNLGEQTQFKRNTGLRLLQSWSNHLGICPYKAIILKSRYPCLKYVQKKWIKSIISLWKTKHKVWCSALDVASMTTFYS
jgi:hypothetical protein